MLVTKVQIAGLLLAAALVGIVSSNGCTLYNRHSAQHWTTEQFQRQQEQINRELITAINQLAARGLK